MGYIYIISLFFCYIYNFSCFMKVVIIGLMFNSIVSVYGRVWIGDLGIFCYEFDKIVYFM